MSLFKDWTALLEGNGSTDEFWNQYLSQEKSIYEDLLTSKTTQIKSTVAEFGEKYNLPPTLVVGFLDGINTSLTEELDLDTFKEDTAFEIQIDLEKLYLNMHKAKAEWLYSIPVWDEILTADQQKAIKKTYNESMTVRKENKVGRNDPCPCGSGKKFKKCCIDKGIY